MTRASHLRAALVAHLRSTGAVHDARVLDAIATVPREAFIAGVSEDVAYEDRALPLKTEGERVLSSISQPAMIGQMLELLDVAPGATVLEIGTGSGYTAALLARLAVSAGVQTIDIEPDLVDAANGRFRELGVAAAARVDDAATLATVRTPLDRVLVTAKATDVPAVWIDALREGGKIVTPLDLGLGAEAAFVFLRHGDVLQSEAGRACIFLPLRGTPHEPGHVFFRNKAARYAVTHRSFSGAQVTVAAVSSLDASWLERYDIVVVRTHAAFGVTLET